MVEVQEKSCDKCKQLIPENNLYLHQLRCTGVPFKKEQKPLYQQQGFEGNYFEQFQQEEEKLDFEELSYLDNLKRNESLVVCQYCGDQFTTIELVNHFEINHANQFENQNQSNLNENIGSNQNQNQIIQNQNQNKNQMNKGQNSLNQQQKPQYASRHRCMMVEKQKLIPSQNKSRQRQAHQEFADLDRIEAQFYRAQMQNRFNLNQILNNFNSNSNEDLNSYEVIFQLQQLLKLDEDMYEKGKGLDANLIQQLPTMTYKKNQNEESTQCHICIQEINEEEEIKILWCLHKFHINCIDNWLSRKKSCPICKADYQPVE